MTMSREYHRNYSRDYYHKKRSELVQLLGGKCASCGSTENLQFDHVDPKTKQLNIGKLLNYSKSRIAEELDKCQLLCSVCHLEKSKADVSRMRKEFDPFAKVVVDLDTGDEYRSMAECARVIGASQSAVSRACRGILKSVHGHRVVYKELI